MDKYKTNQELSETALFVALRRAIANKEYHNQKFGPDYLAEIFLPAHFRLFLKIERIRENTRRKLDRFMPGLTEYVIARTAFFDGLFLGALKESISQIVLLGAGYDSRAYRFADNNHGTRIYELDALPIQIRKLKCLQAGRIEIPDQVRYVPIDFRRDTPGDVLEAAGYKKQERTLFLWEGVCYYLDAETAAKTLRDFGCSSHWESAIAFDYLVPLHEATQHQLFGVRELMESMKQRHAKEPLRFSIKDEELESFLAGLGLTMDHFMDCKRIIHSYLTGEDGSRIGHMAEVFRFVIASPNRS